MKMSRREILLATASTVGTVSLGMSRPALAQSEPIKIGWLAALTGPSSAPAVGFNRGVMFAA